TTEVAVATDAAVVDVQLLSELDRLLRAVRRARELKRFGDILLVGELRGEGRNEVREIRYFLFRQDRPGRHRRIRHAMPADVYEVLMRRQRSSGSRPDLELARREVARPRAQMRSGVSFTVSLLAVALRTVLEVELLTRLTLGIGPDVLGRDAHRSSWYG